MSDLLMEELAVEPVAPTRATSGLFRRLVSNPRGLLPLIWLAILLVICLVPDQLAPHAMDDQDLKNVSAPPSWDHPLGTDDLGRDVLSRLIIGTRPTLLAVLVAVAVYAIVGLTLGLIAGYRGGLIDTSVGRISDVLLSVPGFIVLLVVLSIFGNNQSLAMVALGLLAAPGLIRITRAVTLSVREELFISAARVFGLTDRRIVVRHVLPRIRSTAIVQLALFAGIALAVQTGLAFLGFGPQEPHPSWGGMVGSAAKLITSHPWQIVPPGAVIGVTILAFGLLGNAVRDAVSETWSQSQAVLLRNSKGTPSATPATPATPADPAEAPLVRVRDLSVSVDVKGQRRHVVRSVSFDITQGETVGMVGESGCGKTLTCLGLINALPPGAAIAGGAVELQGQDLTCMSSSQFDGVRGRRIGYVSQEPARALDPMFTVGNQLREAVQRHHGSSRRQANARVIELLDMVHLPQPEVIARRYPHQLSGGMAQRVCIALALAGDPELLVADEPTTALDVTTQAEILALLRELKDKTGMATLLVTHDWGVVAQLCDRAVVMYAGEIVERGPVRELFQQPRHPYTAALLRSNPHVVLEQRVAGDQFHEDEIRPLPTIPGEVPSPESWGRACAFADRCPYATPACTEDAVPLASVGPSHDARCIHSDQVHVQGVVERAHV